MAFGNGGTSVDPTGIITYQLPIPLVLMQVYTTQHIRRLLMMSHANNVDPNRNKIETRHVNGTNYTDILVRMLIRLR